jgi:hypothetical protein
VNGDGGIPWNLLLMLPVHFVGGALAIGLAALLLGKGWDRDVARTGRINGGFWLCACTTCGDTFSSTDRAATDCGKHTSPAPARAVKCCQTGIEWPTVCPLCPEKTTSHQPATRKGRP